MLTIHMQKKIFIRDDIDIKEVKRKKRTLLFNFQIVSVKEKNASLPLVQEKAGDRIKLNIVFFFFF